MIWTPPPHSQFCQYLCHWLCQSCLCDFCFCSSVWRVLKQARICPFSGSLVLHAAVRTYLSPACVCVRVMCRHVCVCVCVCVRCVRGACAVCVRVWWQSGAACGRADLFATRVRVMCHHGCVCSVWCVVCVCVCARALPLCCGSLVLHAALRTYLSLMCVCVCACAVPPRACVCGGGGGAVCVCARVGPLLWQSGTACGCADLFATRSCE